MIIAAKKQETCSTLKLNQLISAGILGNYSPCGQFCGDVAGVFAYMHLVDLKD